MASPHILIPAIAPIIAYDLRATSAQFLSIPFPFFDVDEIVVKFDTVVQNPAIYTVFASGGFTNGFPGGTVNFIGPLSGVIVTIERHVPVERTVDFPLSGPLQTNSLNTQLDKIVAMIQERGADIAGLDARIDILELGDPRLGRALLFPPEDLALNHVLPAINGRNERVMGFDLDGQIAMFSAITIPDRTSNLTLPAASGRGNKVIGFDVSGNFLDMMDVVAGSIVPNAGSISYTAPGVNTAVTRSVQNRLGERISIKDFGTNVGTGVQAIDDAALAAALTFLNADTVHRTLYYPDGVYFHGSQGVALKQSNVTIEGSGEAGTTIVYNGTGCWLAIGDPAAVRADRVTIRNMIIDASGAVAGNQLFLLQNTYDTSFRNLHMRNVDIVAVLGVNVSAGGAYFTSFTDCRGYSHNRNFELFRPSFGGGLHIDNMLMYVDPSTGVTNDLTNVLNSESGTNFTEVRIQSSSFNGFAVGVRIIGTAGVTTSDYVISNCSFTNCKNWFMFLQANAGSAILAMRVASCVISVTIWDGIVLGGQTGINDNHVFVNNDFLAAGRSHILSATAATGIMISNNRFGGANTQGTATAAIEIAGGRGHTIIGNVGVFMGAQWALLIRGGVDLYNVSDNKLLGALGSISVEEDGIASPQRRVHNNSLVTPVNGGYTGLVNIGFFPDSGQWTNTSPFVRDVWMTAGDVSQVFINSIPIGSGYTNTHRLEPGDTISASFTVAPFFGYRSQA